MMPRSAIEQLPKSLLDNATLNGNEYAWPINVIPEVIEAARKSNLLNIGGQLQFRFPDGICECYWVQIDTHTSLPENLDWTERVNLTADIALKDFQVLQHSFDFLAEGREGFAIHIDKYIEAGGDIDNVMCFVWYLDNE